MVDEIIERDNNREKERITEKIGGVYDFFQLINLHPWDILIGCCYIHKHFRCETVMIVTSLICRASSKAVPPVRLHRASHAVRAYNFRKLFWFNTHQSVYIG